jgi:hypothetical protein
VSCPTKGSSQRKEDPNACKAQAGWLIAAGDDFPRRGLMNQLILFLLSATMILVPACPVIFAQEEPKSCDFNIVGTWQSTTAGHTNPTRLRFERNGTATVLSRNTSGQGADWQPTDVSIFKLDNPKDPKAIHLAPKKQPDQVTSMEITQHDDGAFTTAVTVTPDVELTRWVRVDPYRYFVVLVSGKGTPGYGGPAFAMLIKTDGNQPLTEAFGLYPYKDGKVDTVAMAPISEEIRKPFEKEPKDDSAAMFRIEVSAGPFNRAMKVLKTWERRARENTFLYNIPYLDNAVYLNQLASSLNDCAETIKLEKLTWRIDDPIISKQNLPQVPYFFIRELRKQNPDLHLRDEKFYEVLQATNNSPAR